MKILVINGPNLNFLGIRDPEIYGKQDYGYLVSLIKKKADDLGIEVECFQSNHEGDLIDRIQQDVIDPEKQIPVTGVITARIGKPLAITIKGKETIRQEGDLCQKAEAMPTTAEELIQKLQKTGTSLITFDAIESDVEDDVFVPMSAFNHLRRDAMEAYQKKVTERYRRGIS